jgi:hypothetical protein
VRLTAAAGAVAAAIVAFGITAMAVAGSSAGQSTGTAPEWPPVSAAVRSALSAELEVQRLNNCTLRRYGSAHDGGYLMCANLTKGVVAAYSYGIDQEDNWGCDVSRQLGVTIHQYDCFTDKRPQCSGGRFVFHDECVGPRKETVDGKPFDTVTAQVAANGDAGKPILIKMDVEGAEWQSLLAASDEVLDRFVQLPMELHLRGADESTFLELVRRLKRHFYLVNLHFNNWSCSSDSAPLPAPAFQVLWVNKRVGVLGTDRTPVTTSPLNAPDNPDGADCQP